MFQLFDETHQRSYPLTGLLKEIGRSDECDLAIPDDLRLSRVHARLDKDGDDWVLVDLESTNGTFVNGERITEARLKVGDRLEIGNSVFWVKPWEGTQPYLKKITMVCGQNPEGSPEPTVPPSNTKPPKKSGMFSKMKTALKK